MARVDVATIAVEVVYCAASGQVDSTALQLPAGALLGDALVQSGVLQRHGLQGARLSCGVWGKVGGLDAVLRERDRVEIYRPLTVDPKEARRLRYKRATKAKP